MTCDDDDYIPPIHNQDRGAIDIAAMTESSSLPPSPPGTTLLPPPEVLAGSSLGEEAVAAAVEANGGGRGTQAPVSVVEGAQTQAAGGMGGAGRSSSAASLAAVRAAMVEGLYEAMRERLACQAEEVGVIWQGEGGGWWPWRCLRRLTPLLACFLDVLPQIAQLEALLARCQRLNREMEQRTEGACYVSGRGWTDPSTNPLVVVLCFFIMAFAPALFTNTQACASEPPPPRRSSSRQEEWACPSSRQRRRSPKTTAPRARSWWRSGPASGSLRRGRWPSGRGASSGAACVGPWPGGRCGRWSKAWPRQGRGWGRSSLSLV